jgi:hypothetical protein
MTKRVLIAVLLQLLTLNLTVHEALQNALNGATDSITVLIETDAADTSHHDGVPIEEDPLDSPMPESEDELSYTHCCGIDLLMPVLDRSILVHVNQTELEGSNASLLKPPSAVWFI